MKNPTTTKAPTEMAILATVATLKGAIELDYRSLQRAFKNLKECGALKHIAIKLNSTHQVLKAYALELIASLTPIAETECAIATNQANVNAKIAALPKGTIVNNCDFAARINGGDDTERAWLVKSGNGGITLTREGDFYSTYAGDAVRLAALFDLVVTTRKNVATTAIPVHSIARYLNEAAKIGLVLHLFA